MVPLAPDAPSDHCAALSGRSVFVFGGQLSPVEVERFDVEEGKWTLLAPLAAKRTRASAVCRRNQVFLTGGSSASSFQFFDPGRWENLPPLLYPSKGHGAVLVNDLLFVMGGVVMGGVDRSRRCTKRVECYDFVLKRWCSAANMPKGRANFGIAAIGRSVFVVGGTMASGPSASVDRFDVDKNTWHPVAPMNIARSFLAVAAVGQKLFAFGGRDMDKRLRNTLEVYDSVADTWRLLPPMPLSGCWGHAAVTILPNS